MHTLFSLEKHSEKLFVLKENNLHQSETRVFLNLLANAQPSLLLLSEKMRKLAFDSVE